MAQDFGDEMGSELIRFVTQRAGRALDMYLHSPDAAAWWTNKYTRDGDTKEQAVEKAKEQAEREQVIVPFGTETEASYYAQVCRENGIYAAAYADKDGKGFLSFAKADTEQIAGLAPAFRDVMGTLNAQRITDALSAAEPVDEKTMQGLSQVKEYPNLPAPDVTLIPVKICYKDAPDKPLDVLFCEQETEKLSLDDEVFFSGYTHAELTEMTGKDTKEDFTVLAVGDPYRAHATFVKTDAPEVSRHDPERTRNAPETATDGKTLSAEDAKHYTTALADAARDAGASCTDFSDFERRMNEKGYGVTESKKGEVMLYEPAEKLPDGRVPDYRQGRDWPVSATTLKEKYDVDVTHAWFEKNTPRFPPDTREQAARVSEKATEVAQTNGAMDADGRTPDPNLGIESHDGGDTNTRTAAMDAEQTGSPVRPSEIRAEQQNAADSYDLSSESRDMQRGSTQIAAEQAAQSPTRDAQDLIDPSSR